MDHSCLSITDVGILLGFIGLPAGILFRELLKAQADMRELMRKSLEVTKGASETTREALQTGRQNGQ